MLPWALPFLMLAAVAAVVGFGMIAGTAAWIAQLIFLVFMALFVISVVFGRRAPRALNRLKNK